MNVRFHLVAVIIASIFMSLIVLGIWQITYVQSAYDERDETIASLQSDVAELIKTQNLLASAPSATVEAVDGLPLAVFTPARRFTPEQKKSITERLVTPYFAFHNGEDLQAATMDVSEYNQQDWLITVINIDGSTDVFEYGDPQSDQQDWWLPTCGNDCNFSNEFQGRFPEIVQLSRMR